MSRPVRARGLKQNRRKLTLSNVLSRPVRARGLKRLAEWAEVAARLSRPVRARGLKLPLDAPCDSRGRFS